MILFLSKNLIVLVSRIFSNIFAKAGRREIGRRLSKDFGLDALGIGIT